MEKRWIEGGVRHCVCLLCCLFLLGCATARGGKGPTRSRATVAAVSATVIPRKVLFGNPDKAAPRLSPDGNRLGFLAPVDDVLNVWVGPADNPAQAKPVTHDTKRGIRFYLWAYTGHDIVYLQDTEGDENWRVYAVDVDTGESRDLTPFPGVRADLQDASYKRPNEILVGLNDRDPHLQDLYVIDLRTGSRSLLQQNPGFVGFVTDDEYGVRFGVEMTPDGGMAYLRPGKAGTWELYLNVGIEDSLTTRPMDFDKTGQVLYLVDSRGKNTAALATLNLETGEETIVAEDPRADLDGLMIHPTEKTVQGVAFNYERKHWTLLDPAVAKDFEKLRKVAEGDIEVVSRTLDDRSWVVAYLQDNGPVRYYRYDRDGRKAHFLFTNRRELEGLPLVRMHPLLIPSRDGLTLVSYLSLPPGADRRGEGRPKRALPMVLSVHGGPWTRVSWGYNPIHQWFANRGYAVLDVNYRGSTGFGKNFTNAGDLEWGGKMHDDLLDAVAWAVREGIAQRDRIAIFGGSYGGYATLVGLTFTPETFACGVDIVGPSNLLTFLNSIPPYWAPALNLFATRLGDPRTEEGRALLAERSPLTYVGRIQRPLLIGQGANDPRVKQAESDQIVKAMEEKHIPVTYVLYPDEGHGFARPENDLSFYAVTEAFLGEYLGGRVEAIGNDFKGSSITVPAGAKYIVGLSEGLNE